ncbi:hypothetical protein LXA47_03815 [Massilia sp. P8910]|uniref:hypothetical protein n=1 Tax=Massilia antarctica TaxID=2765360 RepID=UPI001E308896|nr:hypothetical protein [Massilia antarctica]MCE3602725.1 hypothetical protein [Massilia antarctica]
MSIIAKLLQLDLFGAPANVVPAGLKRTRVAAAVTGWDLVDHACRHCLGRVLMRRHRDGTVEARCAECGAHSEDGIREVCCCGAECGTLGHVLECFRNPAITPSVPQEILVRERLVVEQRRERRRPKLVGHRDF